MELAFSSRDRGCPYYKCSISLRLAKISCRAGANYACAKVAGTLLCAVADPAMKFKPASGDGTWNVPATLVAAEGGVG